MERQRKVWIVNSSGHDFSAAETYGELIPLTVGKVNIFNVERLLNELKGDLGSHQKGDWVLLSGNTILNILTFSIVLAKHGEVNILIYDAIRKEYVPRELNQNDFKSVNKEGLI